MASAEPRVMTDMELMDFEQSDRCQKSWYAKSLLLTIAAIREDHYYEIELQKSQVGELQTRLRWFEETYSVRALQPLRAPRRAGLPCPHCMKKGAAKLTGDTAEHWTCFDCGTT